MIKFPKIFKNKNTTIHAHHRSYTPRVHWNILLKVFFILFICIVGATMYLFFLIQNNKAFQNKNSIPTTVSTVSVLDERLLKKVEDTFAERAHITETILQNPPSYTDPSL